MWTDTVWVVDSTPVECGRRLVAYGREFTRPRPCKLSDLADAADI